MNRKTLIALIGAISLTVGASGAALAAGRGPAVTVRIEGSKKTRLLPTVVHTRRGWLTKYGAPRGKCPKRSAQGALNVATHGHWKGTWYASLHEYFITSILGEKPSGSDYWTIFVNNKAASIGACDIKLARGEKILFAVTDGSEHPSSLTAPHSAVAGQRFKVKLVGYNAAGKPHRLAHVAITANGIKSARTNRSGVATITDDSPGVVILRAKPKGYVRSEAIVHVAR